MRPAITRLSSWLFVLGAGMPLCLSATAGKAAERPKAATPAGHTAPATASESASVDWAMIGHAAPIPHQLPVVADAESALQAGFAPQWIERSVTEWPPSIQDPDLPAKLILRIAKGVRRPDDRWAGDLASKLRATITATGDADVQRYARVFCGSTGCLCYFEIPADSPSLESFDDVRSVILHGLLDKGGWGQQTFGIVQTDVNEVGELGTWELIYILRPKTAKG
jgi:hypothetical protein